MATENPYLDKLFSNRGQYEAVAREHLDEASMRVSPFGAYAVLAITLMSLAFLILPTAWLWGSAAIGGRFSIGEAVLALSGLVFGSSLLFVTQKMEMGVWSRRCLRRTPERLSIFGLEFNPD